MNKPLSLKALWIITALSIFVPLLFWVMLIVSIVETVRAYKKSHRE